jgi:hypothetical protein
VVLCRVVGVGLVGWVVGSGEMVGLGAVVVEREEVVGWGVGVAGMVG